MLSNAVTRHPFVLFHNFTGGSGDVVAHELQAVRFDVQKAPEFRVEKQALFENLNHLEAHVVPDGTGVQVVLQVRVVVQEEHGLVGLDCSLQEEHEQRTGSADLQVVGEQVRDGFVDERLDDGIVLEVGLKSLSTELNAKGEAFFP